MRLLLSFGILSIFTLIAAFRPSPVTPPQNGIWRATLSRDKQKLPLILDISKNSDGKTYTVNIINGTEKLKMDSSYFQNDSLVIPMMMFDAKIIAKSTGDELKGTYYRYANGKVAGSLPFEAVQGENYKFFKKGEAKSSRNVSGKWATTFTNPASGDETIAVGNFTQQGTDVTGSFLTPTGDYRFLTGSVNGDSLYLSTFDGSFAMLFKAAFQPDGSLKGSQWSGIKAYKTWTARPDANAKLPDATKMTFLKPGFESVDFSLKDTKGKTWTLKDPRFAGKPVIIQIMGSWCPNCMDETNYLAPWYKKNKKRGVEIVGLSFERSDKPEISNPKIDRMVSRFGIEYPVVLAGTSSEESTAKALPMLNKIMSYPTTIFIDKHGKVREIHTGFNGPGTGHYYDEFVADFNTLMDKLISEK
ncbi:peroxiredoxin family protein [Dyadobacter fermentans]|uniref:Alkyl hydroperoxide reductase/ Thiol specific antioxidant/ Mal allergen n=1 Tax=Dyadobacter fermentans (strain ATCC 700827 / DSM 18053 / CIP 107007 / KCTC 52180 / NS114) TaxID=471854 RepID=C6VTW4_DYAFD|nr:TlpA disulfide reductase family protein [Dyadobacter fermentans]ACT94732.1 alkyl hydroperoxide reductase/ Thiol specific antioxidant/ Mal allergen [Dyadobacter fermentans DSM 18053]